MSRTARGPARKRLTDRRRARLFAVYVRLYSGGLLDPNGNERQSGGRL